jgi:hypothetical protein
MNKKNLWADQGAETLRRVVVAGTVCQLDCSATATESPMGAQMDSSISERWEDLVFGAIETSPPTLSTHESDLRTVGAPYPYQAQKSEEPAGFLWGRSYWQRVARFGHPLPAFDSHDSSDSGSTLSRDPQTAGPISQGPPLPCPMVRQQNDVHRIDFIVGHSLSSQRPVVVLNRKDLATGLVGGTVELDRRFQTSHV